MSKYCKIVMTVFRENYFKRINNDNKASGCKAGVLEDRGHRFRPDWSIDALLAWLRVERGTTRCVTHWQASAHAHMCVHIVKLTLEYALFSQNTIDWLFLRNELLSCFHETLFDNKSRFCCRFLAWTNSQGIF